METSGDHSAVMAHIVDGLNSLAQSVARQQDTLTHWITEQNRPTTSRIPPPAIAIPEFNGMRSARPRAWIRDVEKYLRISQTPPELQVDTAQLGLKAKAADWSARQNFDENWEAFRDRFLNEFSDEQHGWETFQTFRNLKHDRPSDFVAGTEKILYELPDDTTLARMFKMQIILDALNPDERSFVLHGTPRTVDDILSLLQEKDKFKTRMVVDRQRPRSQETQHNRRWNPRRSATSTQEPAPTPQPMDIGAVTCYLCGEKGHYKPACPKLKAHERPRRNPRVSKVEAANVATASLLTSEVNQVYENIPGEEPMVPLAYTVEVHGQQQQALIDSGAEVNLIDHHLVEEREYPTEQLPQPRHVRFVDGQLHLCTRVAVVQVRYNQHAQYTERFLVTPMATEHRLLLGMPWLAKHDARINWRTRTLTMAQQPPLAATSSTTATESATVQRIITPKEVKSALRGGQLKEAWILSIRTQDDKNEVLIEDLQPDCNKLRHEFRDIFAEKLPALPPTRAVEATIDTGNSAPVYKKPYRMSIKEKEECQRQLTELLEAGLIQPSTSPWASPVLFVQKKSGEMRMCVDYRALNAQTHRMHYPLPRIDDVFDQLSSGRVFSRLDLKSGYHQMRVAPTDVEKTSFVCPFGQYEYLVAPFGLTNLPSQYSKLMDQVFRNLIGHTVVVYLDDIVIFSANNEDHLAHLRQVFNLLRQHRIFLNDAKSVLGLSKLAYLGFIITQGTLQIDQHKAQAVLQLQRPSGVPSLRSVLGLLSYFRKFIRHFGTLSAPLCDLLKKDKPFAWTPLCETNFEALKQAVCSAPTLQLIDPTVREFQLTTDASGVALGGLLEQNGRPVAFESRKLTATEQRYATHERELLAICHCFKIWRHHLHGATTLVRTDHASLRYLDTSFTLTPRLARMWEKLTPFDYKIVYLDGRSNKVADALSRPADVATIEYSTHRWDDHILQFLHSKSFPANLPREIKQKLREEQNNFRYDRDMEQLFRINPNSNETAWVPALMRADLIVEAHKRLGHVSHQRLYEYLKRIYWWSRMRMDIATAVRTCPDCQLSPSGGTPVTKRGEMHPLPASRVFGRWHIDFIGRLPTTQNGNRFILVAIDATTRWPVVAATKDATAQTVAHFIYNNILLHYGAPEELLSDRGASFAGSVMEHYLKLLGTKRTMTSAYHPQTNSMAERYNQTLGAILTKQCRGAVRRWDEFLPEAVFATRMRVHRTVGVTPFELLYGVKPRLPLSIHPPAVTLSQDEDMWTRVRVEELQSKNQLVQAAQLRTEQCQRHAKEAYDREVQRDDLSTDDWVLILSYQRNKFEPKYLGPFKVIGRGSFDTYRLRDIGGKQLKAMVHRDRLKRVAEGSNTTTWWFKPSKRQREQLEGKDESDGN